MLPDKYIGRLIVAAHQVDDELILTLADPACNLVISDKGQSCCEVRWMSTDDNLSSLIGHRLTRIDCKDGPSELGYECHETMFVEVGTDSGFITLVTHNEHNGYYGGFYLQIDEQPIA